MSNYYASFFYRITFPLQKKSPVGYMALGFLPSPFFLLFVTIFVATPGAGLVVG